MGGRKDISALTDDELRKLVQAPSRRPLSELSDDELAAIAKQPKQTAPVTGASLLAQSQAADRAQTQDEQALQEEFGGTGGQLAAGAEGALRGVSGGVTDAVSAAAQALRLKSGMDSYQPTRLTPEARDRISEWNKTHDKPWGTDGQPGAIDTRNSDRGNFAIAYDLARERQDQRAEANPVTSTLGEIAGMVAPTVLSGGTNLLARGAAATPAAMLARGGLALTKRLAPEGAGMLRQVGAHAVAGMAEGAFANLVMQASHTSVADIENPAQAAESLAWAAGQGMLLGGVTGAAVGGLSGLVKSRAAGRVAGKLDMGPSQRDVVTQRLDALDHIDSSVPHGANPQAVDDVVDQEAGSLLREATQALEARPLSAADIPSPPRAKFQQISEQAAAAGGRFDEAVEHGTEAMRQDMDSLLRSINKVDEHGGIAAKVRANKFNVGHAVDPAPFNEAIDGMRSEIQAWRTGRSRQGLASGGGLAALDNVTKSLNENQALINKAMAKGDVGEAYNLFDQGVKGYLGRARDGTRAEPVKDLVERLYPRAQALLEDESQFGELAARQRTANPSWSDRILKSKDARVQGSTSVAGERSANGWDPIRLANSGWLKNMLSNAGDAGVRDVEEAFRSQLRAYARDASDRTAAWGGKGLRDEAKNVVGAVKRIEDRMDEVALLRRDKMAHEASLKGSTVQMIGQIAGSLGASSVQAAANLALGAKRHLVDLLGRQVTPQGRAQVAAAIPPGAPLERTVQAANQSMSARIAQSAGVLMQTVARGKSAAPVAAATSGMLSEDKHNELVQRAVALNNPGSPQTQALVQEAAQIEKQSPATADAYATKQLRDANYITSKLPPPPAPGAMWSPSAQQDPITERKFRRVVAAVANPAAAIDRIASGRGAPEEADAVRTLNPAMFAQFQQGVQQQLQKLKKPPDLETRLRLQYITGLPLDPSLKTDALRFQQLVASMPDQQKAEEAKADAKNKQEAASMGDPFQTGSDDKFKDHKFRDADQVYASPSDRTLDRR